MFGFLCCVAELAMNLFLSLAIHYLFKVKHSSLLLGNDKLSFFPAIFSVTRFQSSVEKSSH